MSNLNTYEVTVCRTGYGFTRFQVQAATLDQAQELALDEAGNHDYSEKTSEYSVEGIDLAS